MSENRDVWFFDGARGEVMNSTNPYAPPRGAVRDVADSEEYELAGRGARLGAAFLDGLIAAAMIYLPAIVVILAAGGLGDLDGEGNTGAFAVGGLLAFAGFIAWVWMMIVNVARSGQSIAKKIVGIKVVRRDGSRASLGRIFWLRNVVNGLIGIIPLYAFVDVLLIFGSERQCVHDMLADTMVVKA